MQIPVKSKQTLAFKGGVHATARIHNPNRLLFGRLEMVYWMFLTSQSFVTVFLQSKGMTSVGIGAIAAVNSLIGIVALPFWGIVADKIGSSKKAFLTCLLLATLFIALVPIFGSYTVAGILLLTVLMPAIHFFRLPSDSIVNCWIVQTAQREQGLDFGGIRMWGSLGCALMATAYYFLIRLFSTDVIFIVPLMLIGPIVMLARKLPDSHVKTDVVKKAKLRPARLLRDYYYMAYLLFSFLIAISASAVFFFRTFLILDVGGDPSVIGLIVGFQILFEIPAMIASRRLLNRLRPPVVLCMVGTMFVIEHLLYTICTSTFDILLIQMLQGLANGFNTVALIGYIHHLAPKDLKSTAQSLNAMVMSAGGIVASLFGGWAIGAMGIRTLYLITGLNTLFAVGIFMLSFVIGEKLLKKPAPLPLFAKAIRPNRMPVRLRQRAALAMVWVWLHRVEAENNRHWAGRLGRPRLNIR